MNNIFYKKISVIVSFLLIAGLLLVFLVIYYVAVFSKPIVTSTAARVDEI